MKYVYKMQSMYSEADYKCKPCIYSICVDNTTVKDEYQHKIKTRASRLDR